MYAHSIRIGGKARKWIETRRRTRRIRATPLQAITLIAVISIAAGFAGHFSYFTGIEVPKGEDGR